MAWSATTCAADLKAEVEAAAAELSGRAFTLYDADVLLDLSRDLSWPCAGVIYIGMAPIGGDEDPSGLTNELRFDIYILNGSRARDKQQETDEKAATVALLDALRSRLRNTVSPTGHPWQFAGEVPASPNGEDVLGYAQSWTTIGVFNG